MSNAFRLSPSLRALAACALLVTVPSATHAHEHWLSPTSYLAAPGTRLAIGARVGEGLCGPAIAYRAARTVRFELRGSGALDLAPLASEGDSAWARFRPADGAGSMVGWISNFVLHRMDAAAFDDYLATDGLDGPRAARRAAGDTRDGRERYRRCSKLWLSGPGAAAGERWAEPLGLPLEIVPLGTPGAEPELAVRVLCEGAPLAGALVQAWYAPFAAGTRPRACSENRASAAAWQGRTNAEGIVRLPCASRGEWLVGTVHMIPSRDPSGADWESTWASLGFGRLTD